MISKKMKRIAMSSALCMTFIALPFEVAMAEGTVTGTVKEGARDAVKNTKQTARNVSDKACEMVNGKLECAPKKIKHKVQNATDEAKDKLDDVNKE